jgi:hypothetical protein
MAYGKKSKSGGFSGNLVKLGGRGKRLSLKSDMKHESMAHPSMKKGAKQAHKRA